jgi:glycosyltransferase involved in cell wall biosynthesis
MAAGVPVIAVATPEVSEFVSERETALTVSPDAASARALAQHVLDLQANAGMTHEMASRAREHALRIFSAEEFARQMRSLYEQVAARAQPAVAVGS